MGLMDMAWSGYLRKSFANLGKMLYPTWTMLVTPPMYMLLEKKAQVSRDVWLSLPASTWLSYRKRNSPVLLQRRIFLHFSTIGHGFESPKERQPDLCAGDCGCM